ncbi:MAG TPA: hypothetical protein VK663_06055 [Burkholderiales bacterium]|nr:hypothetical protein [Burkholderiales bacterium]
MSDANGLITVRLHPVRSEYDEEFNDWYSLEHVPQVTALPGFVRTRRYFCETADIRYLAWYETTDEKVEAGAHFQSIVHDPTPWSRRMRALYGDNRERMNFRLMCDVGPAPAPDAPWMYIVHTDIPDHIVDEYNEWYDKEHLPRCVNIPGVLRARRYQAVTCTSGNPGPKYLTAYELTGPDVWESPAAQVARKTPWTEKMRSLFSNTRRARYQLIAPNVTHQQALQLQRPHVPAP